ncbi:saccharopine dehydrogenase family protein [Microbacterium sp. zg.Y909]|uniref:saccharopine dehydrogenase family protein n=1 Tax=Microbacterium sp. zg.Y909 TaxID=2969413 RepID=UPI00214C8517|nr:saccharopine dehydrogenase NADP-binding domain-containing protein [Microbacterium sp. zg.Y909]MCR2826806.1 saccharopine dehydrogenase NADP-binding domain-containing protein [Microbacterium sp. zg.Y909]
MSSKIVVLGATGYTGALIVEALVRRGEQPLLAGRDAGKLSALSERHADLPTQTVDATDAADVTRLLEPGDVLITTVGPFERLGWAAAEAAVDAGAHYIDTTGEVGFVRELQRRHDERARAAGIAMLPAFGYDYVPGMLAGALALERAGVAATAVRIGYFATGSMRDGISRGTRATMAEGMLLPTVVRRDGRLREVRTGSRTQPFQVRGDERTGILVSGTEALFLPVHYPGVQTVEDYNGWFSGMARVMPVASRVLGAVAAIPGGRPLIERLTSADDDASPGPDEQERARTRSHVVAVAADQNDATVAEVHLEGPSAYSLTAELMAKAAESLLDGRVNAAGVTGPLQAYGLSGLESLCCDVGLAELPR